jgi:Virulence-associated protein E-like domain
MNIDFALIRRQNPISAYLKRHGIKIIRDKFCCVNPSHDDRNPSAHILDGDEKWYCHGCDEKGDVVDLEALRTGISKAEAAARLGGESWQGPLREPPPKGSKPQLVRDFGPPPEDAPRLIPPRLTLLKKTGDGTYSKRVDHLYEYRDRHGVLQGYVARVDFDEKKEGKDIFPIRWHLQYRAWIQAGWTKGETRPLFNEHRLAERPLDEVLVVEGEKAARIAEALFPHMVCISWMGGDKNADKSDYSGLKGRHLTLWRDNDDVGLTAMDTVARKAQATTILAVPISKDWGDGWDVADVAGLGPGLAEQALQARRPYRFDASPKGQAGKWQRIADGGWLPDDADLITSGAGQVKTNSVSNAALALLHHPEFKTLSFDVMRREILWQGQPIGESRFHILQGRLFAATGLDVGQGFEIVMMRAALARPVHILADRIRQHPWDKIKRVERLWTYFGVEGTDWAVAGFKRWFLGHVARILKPGTKQDLILILEGQQGQGKSTALDHLANAFGHPGYARIASLGTGRMNDNDMMMIAGKTIVELGEMTAARRAEIDHFKDVTSRNFDEYRPPYGRDMVKVHRTASFAGTTNLTQDYLADPTGARRFVPMYCEHEIALEAILADREMLYAEALALLEGPEPEPTYFTPEEEVLQEAAVAERQSQSYVRTMLEEVVEVTDADFIPLTRAWDILGIPETAFRERKIAFEDLKRAMLEMGWVFQRQRVEDDGSVRRMKGFARQRKRRGRPWDKQTLTPRS